MKSLFLSSLPRRLFLLVTTVAVLCLGVSQASAIIDAALQMQLGNPSGATADPNNHQHYLIQRTVEALDYSDALGLPSWASWDLTASDIGSSGRSPDFFTDSTLPPGFNLVLPTDYSGSGYDRGHMCPSADRTDSVADNDLVFYMSNIIPQYPANNQGVWANFEDYCRTLANAGNEVLILCGPSGFGGSRIQPSLAAAIPAYTWKIAVVVPPGAGTALSRITEATRVICLKIPNSNGVSTAWQNYVTSASQIQVDTGLTFFTAVSPQLASVLRGKVDGQRSPLPVISGFSPPNGSVNSSVVISGTNFNFATAVTFNGISAASFNLDSNTQITAVVPTNAAPGTISVTTPAGTAISANSFIVSGSIVDLAIVSAHTGNFTQGDVADTCTITVSNIGSLPVTVGDVVAVTDALPAGLTATAMGGVGWTTDLDTLTCTRSDSLPAGASYPPITVALSVASNAPASVTNTALVSGGGDANPDNDTAYDPTTILVSGGGGEVITLLAWDVRSLPGGANNFGPSPFAPTTKDARLATSGLVRGPGVGTTGTAAARAWGGNAWVAASASAAIAANQFATLTANVSTGYTVSYTAISQFDYRRSATGPGTGVLQYQVGSGPFVDITGLSYPVNTSGGASLNPLNLSGIADLQNVGPGTNVTFRIVNFGGGSQGTWYVFDAASSSAPDFVVQGSISPVAPLTPVESWRLQWFGTANDSGAAADTAIATSDGMPNLFKYALGLNPLVPATNPAVGDISTGHLRLTSPKNPNARDVTSLVEVTDDFLTAPWTTNGTTIDQNTPSLIQVHANAAVSASAGGFIRLRVIRP